jgi:hypothetical protein
MTVTDEAQGSHVPACKLGNTDGAMTAPVFKPEISNLGTTVSV